MRRTLSLMTRRSNLGLMSSQAHRGRVSLPELGRHHDAEIAVHWCSSQMTVSHAISRTRSATRSSLQHLSYPLFARRICKCQSVPKVCGPMQLLKKSSAYARNKQLCLKDNFTRTFLSDHGERNWRIK